MTWCSVKYSWFGGYRSVKISCCCLGVIDINKYGVLGIEIELLEKGKSEVERLNNTIKIIEEITQEKIK